MSLWNLEVTVECEISQHDMYLTDRIDFLACLDNMKSDLLSVKSGGLREVLLARTIYETT